MPTVEKLNSLNKSNGNLRGIKAFKGTSNTPIEVQGWLVAVNGSWKFAIIVDDTELLLSQNALQRLLDVVAENNSEA